MSERVSDENVPAIPSLLAVEIFDRGGELSGLSVQYIQTGCDTAETEWTLHFDPKVTPIKTRDKAALVAALNFFPSDRDIPSWRSIAALKPDVRAQIEARRKWEKDNKAELAAYLRLKAKYEPQLRSLLSTTANPVGDTESKK
jgi:hypothetical protein